MKFRILVFLLISLFISSCESRRKQKSSLDNDTSISKIKESDKNSISGKYNKSSILKIATWNIRDLGRTKNAEEIHQVIKI